MALALRALALVVALRLPQALAQTCTGFDYAGHGAANNAACDSVNDGQSCTATCMTLTVGSGPATATYDCTSGQYVLQGGGPPCKRQLTCGNTVTGSTAGVSGQYSATTAGDIIYEYCAANSGYHTFLTCGSLYDTHIVVRNSVSQHVIGWQEDSNETGCNQQNRLIRALAAQNSLVGPVGSIGSNQNCHDIIVTGSGSNEGTFFLTMFCPASDTTSCGGAVITSLGASSPGGCPSCGTNCLVNSPLNVDCAFSEPGFICEGKGNCDGDESLDNCDNPYPGSVWDFYMKSELCECEANPLPDATCTTLCSAAYCYGSGNLNGVPSTACEGLAESDTCMPTCYVGSNTPTYTCTGGAYVLTSGVACPATTTTTTVTTTSTTTTTIVTTSTVTTTTTLTTTLTTTTTMVTTTTTLTTTASTTTMVTTTTTPTTTASTTTMVTTTTTPTTTASTTTSTMGTTTTVPPGQTATPTTTTTTTTAVSTTSTTATTATTQPTTTATTTTTVTTTTTATTTTTSTTTSTMGTTTTLPPGQTAAPTTTSTTTTTMTTMSATSTPVTTTSTATTTTATTATTTVTTTTTGTTTMTAPTTTSTMGTTTTLPPGQTAAPTTTAMTTTTPVMTTTTTTTTTSTAAVTTTTSTRVTTSTMGNTTTSTRSNLTATTTTTTTTGASCGGVFFSFGTVASKVALCTGHADGTECVDFCEANTTWTGRLPRCVNGEWDVCCTCAPSVSTATTMETTLAPDPNATGTTTTTTPVPTVKVRALIFELTIDLTLLGADWIDDPNNLAIMAAAFAESSGVPISQIWVIVRDLANQVGARRLDEFRPAGMARFLQASNLTGLQVMRTGANDTEGAADFQNAAISNVGRALANQIDRAGDTVPQGLEQSVTPSVTAPAVAIENMTLEAETFNNGVHAPPPAACKMPPLLFQTDGDDHSCTNVKSGSYCPVTCMSTTEWQGPSSMGVMCMDGTFVSNYTCMKPAAVNQTMSSMAVIMAFDVNTTVQMDEVAVALASAFSVQRHFVWLYMTTASSWKALIVGGMASQIAANLDAMITDGLTTMGASVMNLNSTYASHVQIPQWALVSTWTECTVPCGAGTQNLTSTECPILDTTACSADLVEPASPRPCPSNPPCTTTRPTTATSTTMTTTTTVTYTVGETPDPDVVGFLTGGANTDMSNATVATAALLNLSITANATATEVRAAVQQVFGASAANVWITQSPGGIYSVLVAGATNAQATDPNLATAIGNALGTSGAVSNFSSNYLPGVALPAPEWTITWGPCPVTCGSGEETATATCNIADTQTCIASLGAAPTTRACTGLSACPPPQEEDDGVNEVLIIFLAIIGVCILLLLVFLSMFCWRRHNLVEA